MSNKLLITPWRNLSWQDKPRAKFSTLEVAAYHAMHLPHSIAIQPNFDLKTRHKLLLGSLPLDILLPDYSIKFVHKWGQAGNEW